MIVQYKISIYSQQTNKHFQYNTTEVIKRGSKNNLCCHLSLCYLVLIDEQPNYHRGTMSLCASWNNHRTPIGCQLWLGA